MKTITAQTPGPIPASSGTGTSGADEWHVGRSWSGHAFEDACPCPQEPCGLVAIGKASPDCDHHPIARCKSVRQGHPAWKCPDVLQQRAAEYEQANASLTAAQEAARQFLAEANVELDHDASPSETSQA